MKKRLTNINLFFGVAIRTRRQAVRLSQEELAGRAGLHRTYISDVERGRRNLSLSTILKLANALETTISSLMSEAESLT